MQIFNSLYANPIKKGIWYIFGFPRKHPKHKTITPIKELYSYTYYFSATLLTDLEGFWHGRFEHFYLLTFFYLLWITQFVQDLWRMPSVSAVSVWDEERKSLKHSSLLVTPAPSHYLSRNQVDSVSRTPWGWTHSARSGRDNKAGSLFQWACPTTAFLLVVLWRLMGLLRETDNTTLSHSLFPTSENSIAVYTKKSSLAHFVSLLYVVL